ncbi:four helix bundle protein [Rubellicoccus peritrichatus]|uniref:Four helix bundle protein n=1 Tax=Rubellicoccus peritrichatus TaxID=3080537 RepID=A0AAQ3LCC9_9BACT|nr:four helix bundle protein [Puniceicoccus sp. CR14]WOO40948.1 four helix bundle protein [Puniceicoccus sp. CR14]
MNSDSFKQRTFEFASVIIDIAEAFPNNMSSNVVRRQMIRSATSVGANYRAACLAKSTADFIHKMGTVEEEADETAFWLEMSIAKNFAETSKLEKYLREAEELVAITVASIKTARNRTKNK